MSDIFNIINTYGVKSIWLIAVILFGFYIGRFFINKIKDYFASIPSANEFGEFKQQFKEFTTKTDERNIRKDASELKMAEDIGAMKSDIATLKQGINTINAVLMKQD